MIENKAYLFVSLGKSIKLTKIGEPFAGRACLGAFHKVRLLGEANHDVAGKEHKNLCPEEY